MAWRESNAGDGALAAIAWHERISHAQAGSAAALALAQQSVKGGILSTPGESIAKSRMKQRNGGIGTSGA